MPRGYRGIVVTLVGWLALSGQAPNPAAQPDQNKTEANQAQAAQPVAANAQAVEPVQPSEYYRPCEQNGQDHNSDLCAQWKAADAARDAADWTKWGFWAGLAGVIGLLWTLYYTRGAVVASAAALEHARKVSRADLRPWLLHSGFEVVRFKNGRSPDGQIAYGLLARMQLINTGKSPATNAKLFSDHRILPFDGVEVPHFHPGGERGPSGTIGPGRPVSGADKVMGPAETDDIMAGRSCLWLYAKAEYQAPAHEGDDYVSEVCMRIIYNGEEVGPQGSTPRFTAEMAGPQNTLS